MNSKKDKNKIKKSEKAGEDLTKRQVNLLFAMVKEYCDTGKSIGSKELQERYGFDFSPATIRNETVKLRNLGYLHQPFTNSSSKPTERSFKMFIGKLIKGLQVTSKQQDKMRQEIFDLQEKQVRMNKEISKLLASQTGAVGFSLTENNENISGMASLLNSSNSGKISDILDFLDNLDSYKQFLLPSEAQEELLESNEDTKKNKASIRTIIGDENPVIPLGKGYALVSTEVYLGNGEKSVVGLITPVHLIAKKKNLQLLEALNRVLQNPEK